MSKEMNGWTYDRFARAIIWNKRLFIIVVALVFCIITLVLGIISLFPLKEQVPIIIRVDNTNGDVKILTSLENNFVSEDISLDEAFVIKYLRERETYLYNIFEKNYEKVMAMSSVPVGSYYHSIVSDDNNPINPFVAYSNTKEVSVEINNVTHIKKRTLNQKGTAVIRYTTKLLDTLTGKEERMKKIATVSFEYTPSELTRKRRWLNPLGFIVTSYINEDEL